MNKYALVLFLGIVMIASIISISSSDALLPEKLPDVSQAPYHVLIIEGENIIAYARALYTTLDDPSNHEVPTSAPHDGVAKLILTRSDGTFGCSGTLANDRVHVFTAAHCVTDNNGNYILTSGSATFEGNSESIVIAIDADPAKSKAHPDYDGDFIKGNDIAVLKLASSPPSQVPGILHATAGSAVGIEVDKSGYGWSGFFSSGADRSTYPFGTERDGQNKYDAFADTMYLALGLTSVDDFIPQAIYQYDSDDGNSPHDAFDFFFGISNLGLGTAEVISAPGDSGGPTILNGELVGVTSYGITLEYRAGPPPRTSDCTTEGVSPIIDSSCGEFAGDTRVSHYTDFIASVLNTVNDEDPSNTSPAAVPQSGVSTDEDTAKVITLEGTDVDGDAITLFTIASGPTSGSLGAIGDIICDVNTPSSCTADVTYTPDLNFNGPDSFTFTVKDATLTSTAATVDINVIDINDDPAAVDDADTVLEGGMVTTTVLANDSDVDGTLVPSSVTVVGTPVNGIAVANADGTITYTHDGSETTSGSYTYTVKDDDGATSNEATVTITVGEPSAGVTVSLIDYSTHGGRDGLKHLDIAITIINDFTNPVSGASVSITLEHLNTGDSWPGTGTTDSDGIVIFTLNNAPSGTYTTTVTDVTAAGLTWDRVTPPNEFTK